VATLGLTPAMPAMKKYVFLTSKRPEKVKALMLFAALISASPVMIWQTSPLRVQWTSG